MMLVRFINGEFKTIISYDDRSVVCVEGTYGSSSFFSQLSIEDLEEFSMMFIGPSMDSIVNALFWQITNELVFRRFNKSY